MHFPLQNSFLSPKTRAKNIYFQAQMSGRMQARDKWKKIVKL